MNTFKTKFCKVNNYLRQEVEPRMVEDRRWDAGISVGNFLDLIRQPENHFSQQLRVGLKNICSMALKGEARQ